MANTTRKKKNRYSERKMLLSKLLMTFVIIAMIVALLYTFVLGVTRVEGESMVPSYQDDQTVWFLRLKKDYQWGEVVAIHLPDGKELIKRVIAIPGDTIDIHDGEVYLNGEKLYEPYIQGVTEPNNEMPADFTYPITLGEDEYFVMGDNREHSSDSRVYGIIHISQFKGEVF
ncbi:MAG: signal peptidase I [Parasporobacterium sp.]|nr:signal peptidase I [Parasporobacterium sp.]